ncbi:MAG: ferrous iron transporter B, partial [Candidatus Omnitrophica bacterium]|nr:ferrous iron transporter B [Candidatus Omnitrophota bacterium]
ISKGIGRFGNKKLQVIDTPGINSLVAHSEDEKVTKDILSKSNVSCVIQVADSKNLKRSLLLTLELLELKLPLILNLNMSDEAKERGIIIDTKRLSEKLGIDVVETVGITKEGIPKLKEAVLKAKIPEFRIEEKTKIAGDEILLLKIRSKIVEDLVRDVLQTPGVLNKSISETIGRVTSRPITGIPILLLILGIMYLFVGKFAATTGVDFLENTVFGKYLNPLAKAITHRYIHINFIQELLVGEYGIITMALTYAFAIIFPIVTAFFLFFGILEDSGYLPRLTVLSNRVFNTMGLNGRAILPMVLGLGCGTMATLTTRILETKKERILVSLLLSLAIPCSAQLGVIMGLLGSLSINALLIWLAVILSTMIMVGFFASKIIPGSRMPFVQEIPPIRMPQIENIVVKTFTRLKWYLKEAVPLFILGTFILFVLHKIGTLKWLELVLSPLVVGLLSLPEKASEAFIIGFLRRDYGAAGLYMLKKTGALDNIQVLVSLVVITLFVPCIAQFFVTIKERGAKIACLIGGFVFIFASLTGFVLNLVLRYLINNLGIAII